MQNGATSNQSEQTHFYVFHEGVQGGPFSLPEIADRVRTSLLDLNDYLYDERAADWIFLAVHAGLSPLIADIKAETPVAVKPLIIDGAPNEWFALKGELRFGPFAYAELIRLLQEKSLHDSDYVWHSGLKDWQIISDLPEFSADAIRKIRQSGDAKLDDVFFRRRHARIPHDCSVLLHNNRKVYRGQGLEISAGGAGLLLETPSIDIGLQVFLHFKPAADLPPFNAVCEITSRRAINAADVTAPTHYGVKFVKIEPKTTKAIEALAARHAATGKAA